MPDLWRVSRRARAAVTVALALALACQVPSGATAPGGEFGTRSGTSPSSLLLVDVDDATCLCASGSGTVLSGTAGGGILELTLDGTMSTLTTTVEGLPSNHVHQMVAHGDDIWAVAFDPLSDRAGSTLVTRGALEDSWGIVETDIEGGPRKLVAGDGRLVALDRDGGVLLSTDGATWTRPVLPAGVPKDGWLHADVEGDTLGMCNESGLVMVDLVSLETWMKRAPAIGHFDLFGDQVAIAAGRFCDYVPVEGTGWNYTEHKAETEALGGNWSLVRFTPTALWAGSTDGAVISLAMPPRMDSNWTPQGRVGNGTLPVRDLLPRDDGSALVATPEGLWAVEDGEALTFFSAGDASPPSNDIRSVAYAGGILWTMTAHELVGLTFDSNGQPQEWIEGPTRFDTEQTTRLDAVELEGVVYISGFGEGVRTYDTFTSAKPSRWSHWTYMDGVSPVSNVAAVEVAAGRLYIAGPRGLEMMVLGSDPPRSELVDGAPDGVLSLKGRGASLLVGTEEGLWTYVPSSGDWGEPSAIDWAPMGPISSIESSGDYLYAVMDDTVHWDHPELMHGSKALAVDQAIRCIAVHDVIKGPVWAAVNESLMALLPFADLEVHEPGEDSLGDARVWDVEVGPHGIAYVATSSGLHRIGPHRSQWTTWTTSNGLSANDIRDLAVQPDSDALWIGAYGGVDVMDTGTETIQRIGTEDGLPSNLVYDIMFRGEEVWIGTDEGGAARRRLPDGQWYVHNQSTGLVANDVQALASTEDALVFGTDSGVTVWWESKGFGIVISTHTRSSTQGGLPDDWIWCALGGNGPLMVGTDAGLSRFNPNLVQYWGETVIEGFEGEPVRSLAYDRDGRLWVGMASGLAVIDKYPGRNEVPHATLDVSKGLPGSEVLSLFLDSEGMMWVGTSAGVAVVDDEVRVRATITTRDGLVHDRVTSIAERPDGVIWLGTAGGLSRLERALWDPLPQWLAVDRDLPDVYLTLGSVRLEPEEANAGEEVNVSVTLHNPSGLRAIATVALYEDEGGAPGREVASAIAYTEPGDDYTVTLPWLAEGGERTLWVVADPTNVVPESNEGNNVVALNFHVNWPPELVSARYSVRSVEGMYDDLLVNISLNVTYRDRDGDAPRSVLASTVETTGEGCQTVMVRPAMIGSNFAGVTYRGALLVPYGNSTVRFTTDDGLAGASIDLDVRLNMATAIVGIEPSGVLMGKMELGVVTVGPWEGTSFNATMLLLTEPGRSPSGLDLAIQVWDTNFEVDFGPVPEGTYDLWVIAEDDRGLVAFASVEDVRVQHEAEVVDSGTWLLPLLFIAVVVLIIVAIIMFWRGRG